MQDAQKTNDDSATPERAYNAAAAGLEANRAAGLASASRRRTLLRGLGKAGAIAGAAVPLRSLASFDKPGMRLNKNSKYYICSVSGMNSMVHSANTAMSTTCSGSPPSYYKKSRAGYNNWPTDAAGGAMCMVGSTMYRPTHTFKQVFGSGSGTAIGDLVSAFWPNTEAHWVTAILNANKKSPTFPYSAAEVKAFYNNADAAKRTAALDFFQNYLES